MNKRFLLLFSLVANINLHICAQRAGCQSTEWERGGKQCGWGNNKGLVRMKLSGLVHWAHAVLRTNRTFPEPAGY